MRMALSLLALTISAANVNAQFSFTIKQFKTYDSIADDEKDDLRIQAINSYLRGMGDGFYWENSLLGAMKKPQSFCPPHNLLLGTLNYRQIINTQIRLLNEKNALPIGVWTTIDEMPVGFVLLTALTVTFPCESSVKTP